MSLEILTSDFWEQRYIDGETGWDLGAVSKPMKAFIDHLSDKTIKILIPGAGNAYEAEYLVDCGFQNVYVLDWSRSAIDNIKGRIPSINDDHFICGDFFEHEESYDLILEQTFFCALDPSLRRNYVDHCHKLLNSAGAIAGVLFSLRFDFDHPPYGGDKNEYLSLFQDKFIIETMEKAHNSNESRKDKELFIKMKKKDNE